MSYLDSNGFTYFVNKLKAILANKADKSYVNAQIASYITEHEITPIGEVASIDANLTSRTSDDTVVFRTVNSAGGSTVTATATAHYFLPSSLFTSIVSSSGTISSSTTKSVTYDGTTFTDAILATGSFSALTQSLIGSTTTLSNFGATSGSGTISFDKSYSILVTGTLNFYFRPKFTTLSDDPDTNTYRIQITGGTSSYDNKKIYVTSTGTASWSASVPVVKGQTVRVRISLYTSGSYYVNGMSSSYINVTRALDDSAVSGDILLLTDSSVINLGQSYLDSTSHTMTADVAYSTKLVCKGSDLISAWQFSGDTEATGVSLKQGSTTTSIGSATISKSSSNITVGSYSFDYGTYYSYSTIAITATVKSSLIGISVKNINALDNDSQIGTVANPFASVATNEIIGAWGTSVSEVTGNKVAVVVEAYHSGTSWYRLWSDGFLEQGGIYDSGALQQSLNTSITLLKTFGNLDYTCSVISASGLDSSTSSVSPVFMTWCGSRTTTTFAAGAYRVNTSQMARYLIWEARGYVS